VRSRTRRFIKSLNFLVDFAGATRLQTEIVRLLGIPWAPVNAWSEIAMSLRGHEIAMSLRGAYLAMHRQADANFAPYGLTANQFVVLAALSDGAVLTQSEVCRRTYSDPNTMGAMLALMETRGLVKRMRHPTYGRARSVALSPKGKRVSARVWAGNESFRARLSALFTEEESEALLRLLKHIIQEHSAPHRRGQALNTSPETLS
jgi:DNA-binding MarR family transcriptional regulator